jgi:ribosome biogenesis GTPase A
MCCSLPAAPRSAPLLHLPHALCHHVMQQRHLPLLLLLNKCDLVPAAAAAAWTAWLQAALPGVTVLQVSAVRETEGAGGNDDAARRILAAVLDLTVRRGGMDVRVGDFIGMDVGAAVTDCCCNCGLCLFE